MRAMPRRRPDIEDRDRGAATVAMITFMFVFMLGSLLWLSRTVDQSLNDRTNASAVAFQAARSGAQALDPDRGTSGRGGDRRAGRSPRRSDDGGPPARRQRRHWSDDELRRRWEARHHHRHDRHHQPPLHWLGLRHRLPRIR